MQVPVILNDSVIFPFMLSPPSTAWPPLRVERFLAPSAAVLEQGQHAIAASADGVQLQKADWDAGVFGAEVDQAEWAFRLGKGAFVRFSEGREVVVYARVAASEGSTLWLVPERWHTSCEGEAQGWACKGSSSSAGREGAARLSRNATLTPDSPLYQEFLLAAATSAPSASDLLAPGAWSFSQLVGNPAVRHPQAHKLWAGPFIQERDVTGQLRTCTGTGRSECVYFQEPVAVASRDNASAVSIAVRMTTDRNCNSALLCTLGLGGAGGAGGALSCDEYAHIPGFGNVRGWLHYDPASRLYWLVNSFNVDTSLAASGKGFFRRGQRCLNQRGNLGLWFSGDLHNWVQAKVLARSSTNALSLMYVSCTPTGRDLLCVARTNGVLLPDGRSIALAPNSSSAHSSRLVVAFRVPEFRALGAGW